MTTATTAILPPVAPVLLGTAAPAAPPAITPDLPCLACCAPTARRFDEGQTLPWCGGWVCGRVIAGQRGGVK